MVWNLLVDRRSKCAILLEHFLSEFFDFFELIVFFLSIFLHSLRHHRFLDEFLLSLLFGLLSMNLFLYFFVSQLVRFHVHLRNFLCFETHSALWVYLRLLENLAFELISVLFVKAKRLFLRSKLLSSLKSIHLVPLLLSHHDVIKHWGFTGIWNWLCLKLLLERGFIFSLEQLLVLSLFSFDDCLGVFLSCQHCWSLRYRDLLISVSF